MRVVFLGNHCNGIPLEKYDNTVEITPLVLYLFLGIVGKYIVIQLEITV